MDAARDENSVPTRLAVLNTDSVQGTNLVQITVTPEGLLRTTTTDTINFTMVPVDPKDNNYVNVWLFEGDDGLTYPAVANSDGKLLVNIL